MTFIPGFNPSAMSDEELLSRQSELSRRFSWANRFSSSTDMAAQLWQMIEAIEAERRDRVLRVMFQERQKMFPDVIETEPDLVQKETQKETEDHKMIARRKAGRERFTLSRSSAPVEAARREPIPQRTAGPETDTETPEDEPIANSKGDE